MVVVGEDLELMAGMEESGEGEESMKGSTGCFEGMPVGTEHKGVYTRLDHVR